MDSKEHPLCRCWEDSAFKFHINKLTVLDYFSQRSNPFYDMESNNENCRMRRVDPNVHLKNMTGIEYELIDSQENILYLIRKQWRSSTDFITPIAYYYVLNGTVYQCPDLHSIINSRLTSAITALKHAFTDFTNKSRYSPSRGYYWDFEESMPDYTSRPNVDASLSQQHAVDNLLRGLNKTYPLVFLSSQATTSATAKTISTTATSTTTTTTTTTTATIATTNITNPIADTNVATITPVLTNITLKTELIEDVPNQPNISHSVHPPVSDLILKQEPK